MKTSFISQRVLLLLLLVVTAVKVPPATAQSTRLLKVPPAENLKTDRPANTALWKRQGLRSRLTGAQEVDIPLTKQNRSPAPSADAPDLRRAEKNARLRALVETLKGRVLEWQQFEAAQQQQTEVGSEPVDSSESKPPGTEVFPEDNRKNSRQHPADGSAAGPDSNTDAGFPANSENIVTAGPDGDAADTMVHSDLKLPGDFLVRDAVDRVALADNLYAMREFSLAKKMYEQANLQELEPDQQFWVQFQNASCLRQMGDQKAAKKQFRILAGQEEAGWLAHSSRWWLDMIDDRTELEQQLAATQRQLENAGKKVDASSTR